MPLGALHPSKSGLMNKHIVKHTVPVLQYREITNCLPVLFWVLQGRCFIFGALSPSTGTAPDSGQVHKRSLKLVGAL